RSSCARTVPTWPCASASASGGRPRRTRRERAARRTAAGAGGTARARGAAARAHARARADPGARGWRSVGLPVVVVRAPWNPARSVPPAADLAGGDDSGLATGRDAAVRARVAAATRRRAPRRLAGGTHDGHGVRRARRSRPGRDGGRARVHRGPTRHADRVLRGLAALRG